MAGGKESSATESTDAAPKPAGARGASVSDIFLSRLGDLEKRVERELGRPLPGGGPAAAFVGDLAREAWRAGASLLESAATAAGRGGILASWTAGDPVDELGFDAGLSESVREIVRPLARRWLGLREHRSAPLPERGGVLILLNRSAWPLPVEAMVLGSFLCDGRLGERRLAVLWDEDLPELPWVSDFLRRIGVVAASEDNARALLERGFVVLAFPEGRAAHAKTYDRRYRLARFDGKDLVAAALEAGARIVPGAVVGSEESFALVGRVAGFPVTPQFPLLGPLGLLPLPVQWTLRLGAPVEYTAMEADVASVDAVADAVRARLQALLGELLSQRDSIFGG